MSPQSDSRFWSHPPRNLLTAIVDKNCHFLLPSTSRGYQGVSDATCLIVACFEGDFSTDPSLPVPLPSGYSSLSVELPSIGKGHR